MLWKEKKSRLAVLLTAVTLMGACGNNDGAEDKKATGLAVAKHTNASYLAEAAKKTNSEIDVGTKKVEDVKADIGDQVKQWSDCASRIVADYRLSDGERKEWKETLNRCGTKELSLALHVTDSLVRFTCEIDPAANLEQTATAARELTKILKSVPEKLNLPRLCTGVQRIFVEVDKTILIARTGGGTTKDFAEPQASSTAPKGWGDSSGGEWKTNSGDSEKDSKKCTDRKAELRQDKINLERLRKAAVEAKRTAERKREETYNYLAYEEMMNKKEKAEKEAYKAEKEAQDLGYRYIDQESIYNDMVDDHNEACRLSWVNKVFKSVL